MPSTNSSMVHNFTVKMKSVLQTGFSFSLMFYIYQSTELKEVGYTAHLSNTAHFCKVTKLVVLLIHL